MMRLTALVALVLSACSEGHPEMYLRVTIDGVQIRNGLESSEVSDGWAISFEEFAISVPELEVYEANSVPLSWDHFPVAELAQAAPPEGAALLDEIINPFWVREISFRIAPLQLRADRYPSVPGLAHLDIHQASMFAQGVATRDSETISFAWPFRADTRYAFGCRSDLSSETRILVEAGRLFDSDPSAATTHLRFQAIADADADGNGEVTPEELQAAPIPASYDVEASGVTTLWDLLEYQAGRLARVDGFS